MRSREANISFATYCQANGLKGNSKQTSILSVSPMGPMKPFGWRCTVPMESDSTSGDRRLLRGLLQKLTKGQGNINSCYSGFSHSTRIWRMQGKHEKLATQKSTQLDETQRQIMCAPHLAVFSTSFLALEDSMPCPQFDIVLSYISPRSRCL